MYRSGSPPRATHVTLNFGGMPFLFFFKAISGTALQMPSINAKFGCIHERNFGVCVQSALTRGEGEASKTHLQLEPCIEKP